mgnify:CR=1 FL=1
MFGCINLPCLGDRAREHLRAAMATGDMTFDELVNAYVQAIRARQPVGPYYIGGYSFGGRVAYVMAQQMRAAGEEIAFLGLFDVYTLAKLCVCLPAWQARQRHAPLKDRRLDPVVATAFQLTAGMFMVIRKMLARGEPWLDESSRMSPAELYDYADRHGVFISPNGHACGGSRRKIIELMDFLISGSGRRAGRDEGLDAATVDIDRFYRYAMHALTLEALLKLARRAA